MRSSSEFATLTVGELLDRAKRSAAARRYLESLRLYRVPLGDLEKQANDALARQARRRARSLSTIKRRTKP